MEVGWELIGIVSIEFFKNDQEPIIREFIIKKWIENIKMISPHCEGAELRFIENLENTDLIKIYAKCDKWEL